MLEFRRSIAAASSVLVGAASFGLSYVAQRDVAIAHHAVPDSLAFLVPVVVDGGILCGSATIWAQSKMSSRRPWFAYLFVGALLLTSVLINVSHAGADLLAKTIAGLPPLVLLGTLELVAAQKREDVSDASAAAVTPAEPVHRTTPASAVETSKSS